MMKMFKRKKGQAIVELSILFPFFLLVVVGGIIDFGWAFYSLITLQQIANETAQFAASPYNTDGTITLNGQPEGAVRAFAATRKPQFWPEMNVVSVETIPTSDNISVLRRVTLSYRSQSFTPFWQTMFQQVSGDTRLLLTAAAAFQVPRNLN